MVILRFIVSNFHNFTTSWYKISNPLLTPNWRDKAQTILWLFISNPLTIFWSHRSFITLVSKDDESCVFFLSEMDESNYMEKITPRPIWNLMRQLQASSCRLSLDFLCFLLCYFLSRYNMFSGILWSGILMFIASDQLYTIFLLKIPNRSKTAHDNEKFMLIDHQQLCACCWQGSRDMCIITCLYKKYDFYATIAVISFNQ